MFGWRSKQSKLEQARLRQAFRKRLIEVLRSPEEGSAPSAASRQTRLETAPKTNTELALIRAC